MEEFILKMEDLEAIGSLPNTQWEDFQNLTDSVLRCQGSLVPVLLHASIGPASATALLLAFLQKRKNMHRCCWGRPSYVAPINLLDQYDNRWTYGAVYGAIPNLLISVFLGFDGQYFLQEDYPTYLKSLYTLAYVQMVCLSFYPLFACLNTEFKLTGSIIGFLYSSFWFLVKTQGLVECIGPYSDLLWNITLVINLPSVACLGFVVVRYFVITIQNIKNGSWSKSETDVKLAPDHMLVYVKRLMVKPSSDNSENCKSTLQMVQCKIENFFKANFYDKDLPFKYSPRIICVFSATVMCTYLLGSLQFLICANFLDAFKEFVIEFNNVTDDAFRNKTYIGRNIETIYYMVEYSWEITNTLVSVLFVMGLLRLLINYRKHTLMLYKGDTSFIPESYIENVRPSRFIANTTKFAGYQIAYMLWGQIIFTAVGVLLSLLFCFVIVLPPIDGNFEIISYIFEAFGIPVAVSIMIFIMQEVTASVFFVQNKLEKDDSSKPLALDNLRAFRAWDYFMFLNNITTGLISCLFRVIKSLFIGLLYLSRMDRSVLMAGFENLDTGFNAYIGMMMVERYNNHPVLRTFCQVTAEASQKNNCCSKYGEAYDVESDYVDADESDLELKRRSTRAVTKWHLAYTLINNPKLKEERHHQLERPEEESEKLNEEIENNEYTKEGISENEKSSNKLPQKGVEIFLIDVENNRDYGTFKNDQSSVSTNNETYSNSNYQSDKHFSASSRRNSLSSTSSVMYVTLEDLDCDEIKKTTIL